MLKKVNLISVICCLALVAIAWSAFELRWMFVCYLATIGWLLASVIWFCSIIAGIFKVLKKPNKKL